MVSTQLYCTDILHIKTQNSGKGNEKNYSVQSEKKFSSEVVLDKE